MTCPRCQAENRVGARFCRQCGATFAADCPSCGAKVEVGSIFCDSCGAPLGASPVPGSPSPRFTSPEAYTPRHLAERILTSKTALEGERKQVTVLFADLKGSMELLADRDPEDARRVVDPVLERMMEAVHRYEGTVNQVMGDGIMALFGAPLAHEDHAVRACYAALRMQETVGRHAEGVRRSQGILVQIRIGLNSGEVVVRSIGSDLQMDYTAVGQTTHLAARMEQMATPGTILMTAGTLRLAEGFVQVKAIGPRRVKGLSEPVKVYEVTAAGTVRSRFQALAARGLTKFVGRAEELEQLATAMEQARAAHGQVVAVVGEPGVGKSRLFWEFTHSHRTEGCLKVEGASVSYGKATSYFPVIELLKTYFQIEECDDHRKVREKVMGKLLSLDCALEASLSPLLALLDVPTDDEQWMRLEPSQRRQRTLDGIKWLLLCESRVHPLLVVFEDLHWIDTETQALLDRLVESVPSSKMLLLVSYRPEYQHAWGSKTYYRLLRIDPLPTKSAAALLDALLGAGDEFDRAKQLLIDRTEGNPFLLEESVRTLVETGVLAGDRGAYRLTQPLHDLQIPATMQAILAARIDRLSPEDKRLLQAAAVIGKDVPLRLLCAIAEENEESIRVGLARLQAAEFLYETQLFPDLEYTFKHALTYEVAYASLLHDRRRRLHVSIVNALETLHADRLHEYMDALARHAWRGELWAKAVSYLHQRGRRAVAHSASAEAVASLEQALAALGRLPRSRETLERGVDLRLDLQGALVPLGELRRMLDYLQEAEERAQELGDQRRVGRITASMSHCFWWMGEANDAVRAGRRALAIASAVDDVDIAVVANVRLGQAYYALGDYGRSIEVCRETIGILKGDLLQKGFGLPAVPAVVSRVFLGKSLAALGEFAEGLASTEDAVRVAEIVGHQYSTVLAYWGLGDAHMTRGNLTQAVSSLERALGLCQGANFSLMTAVVSRTLGEAYVMSSRATDALRLLEQAVEQIEAMRFMPTLPLAIGGLSEGYLLDGRLGFAQATDQRARELCRTHGQRATEAYVLRVLGDIYASLRPPDITAADSAYRDALAIAVELGMRPMIAHCHLRLGRLHQGGGDRSAGEHHLACAVSLLGAMEMKLWLPEARARLATVRADSGHH